MTTGASVAGRILAQNGAVTMDTNQITVGSCGGSSSGDPHFITFDGLYYSLMTPGDFILVRSPTVVVQARHALICSGAAVNVAAAAQLGSDRVAVFVAPLRVFVNGAPTTLTSAATRLPGGATASLNNAVVKVVGTQGSVTFTGLSSGGISGWINLGITLTSSLSTVTGLLGNSDGNPSNDLATRDGQNLALPVTSSQGLDAFAATWAVPPSESLFGGVTSLASQQSSTCPPSASALSAAQAVCTTAGISNPTLLEACMFDVAVTGNPDAAEVFVSLPPPKLVLSFDDVGAAVQRPVNDVAGCSTTPGRRGGANAMAPARGGRDRVLAPPTPVRSEPFRREARAADRPPRVADPDGFTQRHTGGPMTSRMRAAVVEQFGTTVVLRERDVPSPGAGQILVKTTACGVCHSDLHAARGDWPLKPALPFIPGHEAIGVVAALGSGVTTVREGDRVGVPWLYSTCGQCEYCLTGRENVCPDAQFGGYTRDGGFADYLLADPRYVAHIPAGIPATQAAPIICAGVTTYKGIKQTEARPGEWIAISGAGGLGHMAIQYAKAMGLHVCAVDIDDGKLAHASRLGADLVVNASVGDPQAAVRKGTGGGAHGVLITAPSLGAFKQGVGMTRRGGTCVLIGLPPGEARSRSSMLWRTASPCADRSSGRARTWRRRSLSPQTGGSKPTSSYSPWHRSTRSSGGSSTATLPPAWSSTSRGAQRRANRHDPHDRCRLCERA